MPMVTVSIVSHQHGAMVTHLVEQLLACREVGQIVVTLNVPEQLSLPSDPRVSVIHNTHPKGFGANHNAAFTLCTSAWFLVLNPDVILQGNPFPKLCAATNNDHIGIIAPLAIDSAGVVQDCWRSFPTFLSLLGKVFQKKDHSYQNPSNSLIEFTIDWASGLCLLFRHQAYVTLKGFDECFFLYYEDVDMCIRAWRSGFWVVACPSVTVIHDGQRASRKNYQHMRWHLASMARYFWKHWGRLPRKILL